jgi:hypothetical protein
MLVFPLCGNLIDATEDSSLIIKVVQRGSTHRCPVHYCTNIPFSWLIGLT